MARRRRAEGLSLLTPQIERAPAQRALHSVLLVHNPTAGRRRAALVERVVRGLTAAGVLVEVRATGAAGDARRIAATLDRDTHDALLVAGGDGTINEAVSGLVQRADAGVPLGLVPCGTANVLAIELGLAATADAIVGTVVAGRTRVAKPGVLTSADGDRRHFMLMAGAGFDAHVVAGVTPAIKRRFGKAAYGWRAAVEIARAAPRRYRVVADGTVHEAGSVVVTRARHYAGPYMLAPDADITGDRLQVVLLDGTGRWTTAAQGLDLLRGRLSGRSDVRIISARHVSVAACDPPGNRQPLQIDGDSSGGLPCDITVSERTVNLIV
jgi:diacylglycerol kinase (ATP)